MAAAGQFRRTALFGAAAILRREQLLAACRRERGRPFGDQAQLAPETDRHLAPPGRGPQGVLGDLYVGRHMRILAGLDRRSSGGRGGVACPGR
jgi:hypothetical protein